MTWASGTKRSSDASRNCARHNAHGTFSQYNQMLMLNLSFLTANWVNPMVRAPSKRREGRIFGFFRTLGDGFDGSGPGQVDRAGQAARQAPDAAYGRAEARTAKPIGHRVPL